MFWSCCGFGRKRNRRDSEEPDETTRLLATSDALFPQVQEAPRPIDDAALLEYRRRIDRILEETAEKLVSVSNAPQHPLTHIHSNSSSTASTSTAKASRSTKDGGGAEGGGGGLRGDVTTSTTVDGSTTSTTNGRDTLWRAEAPSKNATKGGSVYSMKKVTAAKNSKAKGKEVAREVERGNNSDDIIAGLPNGNAEELAKEDKTSTGGEEHDRDATVASYRTANEADDDDEEDDAESEEVSEQDGESSDDDGGGTEEDGDHTTSSSQAASSRGQRKRIGQSHDRSKRSHRAVQDIFREDSLTKSKPQERLQKALALSDEDFSRQLTQ